MDGMRDHVFGRLDPSIHADGELGEYFNCQMAGRFQDHHGYKSEIGSDDRRHATEVDAYKGGNGKGSSEMNDLMKAQIANHPRYPNLVSAYLECRKVGAPLEVTTLLEETEKERLHSVCVSGEIGDDPELDDFMEAYCEVLLRYKVQLSKPFDEARTLLGKIQRQLSNLCKDTSSPSTNTYGGNEHSDDAVGSSEDEHSYGVVEESEIQESNLYPADKELKEMLMKKYSGYLSSLRKEFLKRRKKGKLPKAARLALLNWWNTHYRWPYPTDGEKIKLGEQTGLDQKQINNWFINQRKRHWKPSEDMRLALMEGVSGVDGGPPPLYFESVNDDSY